MSQNTQKVHRVSVSVIEKMPRSNKPIPGGLVLYRVNTEEFKETIHYRLSLEPEEKGAFWVHSETGLDYMVQLLAEYKRTHVKTGRAEWVKKAGVENHLLDAEVYCAATVDEEWGGGIYHSMKAVMSARQRRNRGVISKGVKN